MSFSSLFQDELKAMDDSVKEAIRREDRKQLVLVSVTVATIAFFIYVLTHLI
jgi:hypothetical protein